MLDLQKTSLRRWRPVLTEGAQVVLLAAVLPLITASRTATPELGPTAPRPRTAAAASPAPPPVDAESDTAPIPLHELTPDEARLWNAANPVSRLPNPAARPFHLKAQGVLDEARAADCMTAAIYFEAKNESVDGQRAVAQVVLNRLRHPAFPKTICGVVFQSSGGGCQFTFTCDGTMAHARTLDADGWQHARKVAEAALHGYVMRKVGEATHYHAVYVAPYWSPALIKVATIGAHIFYRWTGGAGLPPAFGAQYSGDETKGVRVATLDALARKTAKLDPDASAPGVAVRSPPLETAVVERPVRRFTPARSVAATEAIAAAAPATALDASAIVPDHDPGARQPQGGAPPAAPSRARF